MPFAHDGFILDEDEALKAHLTGFTVSDEQAAARPVVVRFGYGDPELSGDIPGRQITWPFITINLLAISEEKDRAHRGVVPFTYIMGSQAAVSPVTATLAEWPIPMALDYEIVSHSRSARHDRQITAKLVGQLTRFDSLDIDDGTVRRLDLLSGPEDSPRIDADGKREYRTVWTVRVSSEIAAEVARAVARATGAGLTLIDLTSRQDRALTQVDTASAVETQVSS